MKSIITLALLAIKMPFPGNVFAQEFDRKIFCKDLNLAVTAFSQSIDSLKGKFIGENALGIQQWEAKYALPGAIEKFYERTLLDSEEFRAAYILMKDNGQKGAEELYNQIVQAVRWCYGVEYSLSEQETSEWDNSGKKHQHHEATFTFAGVADKGIVMPIILVRCFSIESGLYSVTVELFKIL